MIEPLTTFSFLFSQKPHLNVMEVIFLKILTTLVRKELLNIDFQHINFLRSKKIKQAF